MTPEERIAQLAATRGASVPIRRVSPCAVYTAPPDPILDRPLPMAWRGRSTYSQTRQLAETERRVACQLVAKALGAAWHRVIDDESSYLVHDSGLRLRVAHLWSDMTRYSIRPLNCGIRQKGALPEQITVSAGRSPRSIARDISNRILALGAVDAYLQFQASQRVARANNVRARLDLLAIAQALGMRQLADPARWKSDGYPETNTAQLGGLSVHAELSYSDRVTFSIECTNRKTAQRVAETLYRLANGSATDTT